MKDFIVLDWCVADICNMNCEYCISSDIKKRESTYKRPDSKTVLDIALRISELSSHVRRITVNMCGGEPLLAENIDQAIEILSGKSNIELVLITNFKLIDKIRDQLSKFRDLFVSLHIKYRSEEEISSMIDKINKLQLRANISLSQVDYKLSERDITSLAGISFNTNKSINLQTYNIPIIDGGKGDFSNNNYYESPFGKYCLIGNMFFNISSDGTLLYNLWCHDNEKSGKTNFLGSINDILEIINSQEYHICPYSYCPCNYNVTFHEYYLSAMKESDIDKPELFEHETRKEKAMLSNQVNALKIENSLKQLENNNLKAHLAATESAFAKLKEDYNGMKSTYSWRIGYFITETLKYVFGWTPFVKNYLKNKNRERRNG